jgi:hypothetical protein
LASVVFGGAPLVFAFSGTAALAAAILIGTRGPVLRAGRVGRTWYVLTAERVGAVVFGPRTDPMWVEHEQIAWAEVVDARADGSGTLRVHHRPDRYGMAPDPLVIGRIPDVRNAADLIDLLGRDQR